MSEANKRQVGGTHYKTGYEHWDWVIDNSNVGAEYLIGVTTKYVARWRKKGGIQDLEKAFHYVNKLIECLPRLKHRRLTADEVNSIRMSTNVFARRNELSDQEADFCEKLMLFRDADDVFDARAILLAIMEQADATQPVPLEDSNKHADRDYSGAVTGRMPGVPHGE